MINEVLKHEIKKNGLRYFKLRVEAGGDSVETVWGLFMSGKTVFEIFSCNKTVFDIHGEWYLDLFVRFFGSKMVFGYF